MLHLKVLEEAGLVIVRREGRQRWNHLDVAPVQAIYSRWIEPYAAPAAGLLLRLRRELEGGT
jgi:DNA-binding transcriptional ArsR family regulator